LFEGYWVWYWVLGMGPYPDATKIGQTIKKTTMFAHTIFSILANWLQR
jgi:hypothetical protein